MVKLVLLLHYDGTHPGLKLETHHNPLDAGFPNGTVKGDLEIDLIILGGEEKCGHGWRMLMECLAGRAISLPSSVASSWVSTYGVSGY